MASIVDSFRETFSDHLSFLKLSILAIPVYFAISLYVNSTTDFTMFWWVTSATAFLLFGFLIKTTSSVLNERDTVMPSLNPFKLLYAATKGTIAIAPIGLVSIPIANYVCAMVNVVPWFDTTIRYIVWMLVAAMLLTAFLMFVKKERIKDAFNIKTISDKSGDFMLAAVFFLLQLAVVNFFTTGFLGYSLIVLFGEGPIFYFFLAFAIVFNVAVTGHYMAQLQYEVLGYDRNKF